MGQRAECVMLNTGPHIVACLGAILGRMDRDQSKRLERVVPFGAWDGPGTPVTELRELLLAPRQKLVIQGC